MSTTTATFGHAATTAAARPRKSFFQRLIEARTRQGEARISATFERMSDAQLSDLGFSADQVRRLRATGKIPLDFWS
ncbi:MAG: hypothetical protein AB7O57_01660 [Hyphomicrobiaceae bacterium]